MADQEQLKIVKKKDVEAWNKWREDNPNVKIDLSYAQLQYAELQGINLTGADLSEANFSHAKLQGINLTGADLSDAKFIKADVEGAYLKGANLSDIYLTNANLQNANLKGANLANAILRYANLTNANLQNANLEDADLHSANLEGAKLKNTDIKYADLHSAILIKADLSDARLKGADIKYADLSDAQLKGVNLEEVKALGTIFKGVNLTGVCIENWNINSQTDLNNVICNYLFLKADYQDRFPLDRDFYPEEFTKLFTKASSIIELIFYHGVDWVSFAYSFKKLSIENEGAELVIESIENRNGVTVVKVKASPDTDKVKLHGDFQRGYEFAQKSLREQYEKRLLEQDKSIDRQVQQINQLVYLLNKSNEKLGEVPKLVAQTNKTENHFHAPVGSVDNKGTQSNIAGEVKGDQSS